MKVDRTPFTIYDFIGYFIPGFVFLYILYLTFNIDFDSILTLKKKMNNSYEYVVFSVFIFIFSWFVGHLLARLSHFLEIVADKIFENDCNGYTGRLYDPFKPGRKKIFSSLKQVSYKNLLDVILKKMVGKKGLPSTFLREVNGPLFLKTTAYYLDPEKYSIIYNYLVIKGSFRAFTFSFIIIAILLLFGNFFDMPLEYWVQLRIRYIFIGPIIISYTCWNIYIKFYRRQIEESVICLIHELYLKDSSKNKDY